MVQDKTFYEIRYLKQLQSFKRIFDGVLGYESFKKVYHISAETIQKMEALGILKRRRIGHITIVTMTDNKRYMSNYKVLKNEYLAAIFIHNESISKYLYSQNTENEYIVLPKNSITLNIDYLRKFEQRGLTYLYDSIYQSNGHNKKVNYFCLLNVRHQDYSRLAELIYNIWEWYACLDGIDASNNLLIIDLINSNTITFSEDKLYREINKFGLLFTAIEARQVIVNVKSYNILAEHHITL